jgi:hypothetical protein
MWLLIGPVVMDIYALVRVSFRTIFLLYIIFDKGSKAKLAEESWILAS